MLNGADMQLHEEGKGDSAYVRAERQCSHESLYQHAHGEDMAKLHGKRKGRWCWFTRTELETPAGCDVG